MSEEPPKKNKGYKFPKGVSGNPTGRPKDNPMIKKFKETTYEDFIKSLQKYGRFTRLEIAAEIKRTDATMFEIMFAQIVASAASGNKDARQVLLDRLWGKVKEEFKPVDLEGKPQIVVYLPDNQRQQTIIEEDKK